MGTCRFRRSLLAQLRGLLTLTLVGGVCALAGAQYGGVSNHIQRNRFAAGAVISGSGKLIQLQEGDLVKYTRVGEEPQTVRLVRGADIYVRNVTQVEVTKPNGSTEKLFIRPEKFGSYAIYPVIVWSVAGSLQADDLSFVGGTKSLNGTLVAASQSTKLGNRVLEFGGWFYFPRSAGSSALFQIETGLMFTDNVGLQVAYINSTNDRVEADSTSYHALVRLGSDHQGSLGGRDWSAQLGLGAVQNVNSYKGLSGANSTRKGNTVNFSSFLQLGFEIQPGVSIDGSWWYLRDRNVDVTRFGIGVSFHH